MIRAARVDRNQPEIVAGLRKLGCSVLIISQLKNCFDILVGIDGHNIALEIKDGLKPIGQQKLTEGEQKFFDSWRGNVFIANDLEMAVKIIERILQRNLVVSKK